MVFWIILMVLFFVWLLGYIPFWIVDRDDWARKIKTKMDFIGHNFIPFYWWYKFIREYIEKQIELYKRLK